MEGSLYISKSNVKRFSWPYFLAMTIPKARFWQLPGRSEGCGKMSNMPGLHSVFHHRPVTNWTIRNLGP